MFGAPDAVFPGVFCLEHVLYLVLFAIVFVSTILLMRRYVKNDEKLRHRVYMIVAGVLLCLIIVNRITITYYEVEIEHKAGVTWLNLIPNTFCGLCSFVYAFAILLGKRNNKVLHFIVYAGLVGGLLAVFYPDFLARQTFWDIRTVTGLLHHTVMAWLSISLIATGEFTPDVKEWYTLPVGLCIYCVIGIFELDALGFVEAMYLYKPLVSGVYATSWFIAYPAFCVAQYLFLVLWGRFFQGRAWKEVLPKFMTK